jgi:hypothetical protein
LGRLSTERSNVKPSQSDTEIVELKPPAEFGFSGTVKFDRVTDAASIAVLKARGYVVVNTPDSVA